MGDFVPVNSVQNDVTCSLGVKLVILCDADDAGVVLIGILDHSRQISLGPCSPWSLVLSAWLSC